MLIKRYRSLILLFIAFLSFYFPVKSQNKPISLPINAKGQIEYTEYVAIPNTPQSILSKRALHWMVISPSYKFRKMDLVDSEYGRFISSGTFNIGNDEVFISLIVDVKSNKAQIKISNFDYNISPGNIPLDNLSNQKTKAAKILIPKVSENMKQLIKSFKEAMLSSNKV